MSKNKNMPLFELFGFFSLLDLIADYMIPDFRCPKLPSFAWFKKHAYSAFAVVIKAQITNHIYKFLSDVVKANGNQNEVLAFEFAHEVFTLLPAFWVAVDLYRHSIKPKIPCFFAKIFAHLYVLALVCLIGVSFLDSKHQIATAVDDKLVFLIPSFVVSIVYLRKIRQ